MAEHESPRLRLPRARNANPLIVERFNLPDPQKEWEGNGTES
jgi:hypothetical protein